MIYVCPADGIKIRDPVSKSYVPPEGMYVEPSQYWQRRVNDGDVTIHKTKPVPPAPTPVVPAPTQDKV